MCVCLCSIYNIKVGDLCLIQDYWFLSLVLCNLPTIWSCFILTVWKGGVVAVFKNIDVEDLCTKKSQALLVLFARCIPSHSATICYVHIGQLVISSQFFCMPHSKLASGTYSWLACLLILLGYISPHVICDGDFLYRTIDGSWGYVWILLSYR